jgi:hypothetical protein
LYGSSIGVIAEPTEKSSDAICVVEDLNVLGPEFKIVLVDGSDPLCSRFRNRGSDVHATLPVFASA